MKQLLRVLSLKIIENIIYTIDIIMDNILYIVLFFLSFNGLFCVSAGAYIPINKTMGIEIIYFTMIGIVIWIHKSGNPTKNSVEDIKQSILLLACTPNAVNLMPLKINRSNIVSFTILNKKAKINTTNNLVIVK